MVSPALFLIAAQELERW